MYTFSLFYPIYNHIPPCAVLEAITFMILKDTTKTSSYIAHIYILPFP